MSLITLARAIGLAFVSPLMEKNPLKLRAAPVVLSMSRLIVLAFAIGMLRQLWAAGIAGLVDGATLWRSLIVLALPILNALDRSNPHEVLSLAESMLSRFGEGGVRSVASLYSTEPSKRDDHRDDGVPGWSAPLRLIPGVPVSDRRHSRVLQSPLAAERAGIMLHYDDSSRDDWAVAWFDDPACTNGYTWLVLDNGAVVELADPGMRTPHAGACRTPLANSRLYGVSAATNGLVLTTPAQQEAIVTICVALCRHHQWSASSIATRIVGHDAQAIWTPANTRAAGISDARARPLWNTLGRKVDPTGIRADRRPILSVTDIQQRVAKRLQGGT